MKGSWGRKEEEKYWHERELRQEGKEGGRDKERKERNEYLLSTTTLLEN